MKKILTMLAMAIAPFAMGQDIAGLWKAEDGPGWIEITVVDGVGSAVVRRNDNFPERVGTQLGRNIIPDPEAAGEWKAELYAQRLEEYREGTITLPEENQMTMTVKVGFLNRSIDWQRVDALPENEVAP